MKDWFDNLCLALAAGGILWVMSRWHQLAPAADPQPAPAPVIVPVPAPEPSRPRKSFLPWRGESTPAAEAVTGGAAAFLPPLWGASPNAPDGTEPEIDYPDDQWMKNIGSRKDGAGMCVFTSFEHTCRWAGLEEFRGFRDWCAAKYPGGGYPEKLAKLVKAYCQVKAVPRDVFDPDRDMVQIDAASDKSLSLLEAALRQNLLPCVTLYQSPRYGRGTIYHMVNCAHFDGERGAILDNNFRPLEWASRAETIRNMSLNGRLWAVVILKPGPPMLPRN